MAKAKLPESQSPVVETACPSFAAQYVTVYRSKLVRKLEALGLKVTLEPAAT